MTFETRQRPSAPGERLDMAPIDCEHTVVLRDGGFMTLELGEHLTEQGRRRLAYGPVVVAREAVAHPRELAEMFPTLNIIIYHNPALHHVTLPVESFERFIKIPQVVGMKDSHRDTLEFMKLMTIIRGKISVLCNAIQYVPYAQLGASGFWSIDSWMGPWPLFALRDAVSRGDIGAAKAVILDIAPPNGAPKPSLSWRETGSKIAIAMAGYVEPGPLRPPFLEIPPEVVAAQKKKVERWQGLCAKYAPAYQAAPRKVANA